MKTKMTFLEYLDYRDYVNEVRERGVDGDELTGLANEYLHRNGFETVADTDALLPVGFVEQIDYLSPGSDIENYDLGTVKVWLEKQGLTVRKKSERK